MAYVRIDMDDIDSDDLTEELESRGYTVIEPDGEHESVDTINRMEDDIYNLYQDFICWKDLGMKDSTFEVAMKRFFEKHTDKIVA